ncbi:MAG: hypothetical protein Q7R33_04125 [Nitrosarchaeum sp.]|nr:hypothetical protein [Nitrosarchaeum sp.]
MKKQGRVNKFNDLGLPNKLTDGLMSEFLSKRQPRNTNINRILCDLKWKDAQVITDGKLKVFYNPKYRKIQLSVSKSKIPPIKVIYFGNEGKVIDGRIDKGIGSNSFPDELNDDRDYWRECIPLGGGLRLVIEGDNNSESNVDGEFLCVDIFNPEEVAETKQLQQAKEINHFYVEQEIMLVEGNGKVV